jgi:hypothetical protein
VAYLEHLGHPNYPNRNLSMGKLGNPNHKKLTRLAVSSILNPQAGTPWTTDGLDCQATADRAFLRAAACHIEPSRRPELRASTTAASAPTAYQVAYGLPPTSLPRAPLRTLRSQRQTLSPHVIHRRIIPSKHAISRNA